jgi:MFS family permease
MIPETLSRRTVRFVNIAHALDHFVLLIYPTAVIAIAAQSQMAYAELIGLATGAFLAFGLGSLPMGWLADRFGRRNMLAMFFFGYGVSCLGLATANGAWSFAIWLLVLGIASAIYHPVGSTMLVTHASRLGRDLGINGVWGNLGAASASGVTAFIATLLSWRAAFIVPGLACLAVGTAFVAMVPGDGDTQAQKKDASPIIPVSRPLALLAAFAVAIIAGGVTFNVTTIALPKVIDERLGLELPLMITGSIATVVFLFGALMQLLMGRMVDRYPLPTIFIGLSLLQPLGLGLAAWTTGVPLLLGLMVAMAAIYGQVIVNDAMVARFVPARHRANAYSIRYFLGFSVSGLAVPLIALLHDRGGFSLVLAMSTAFGLAIWLSAVAFHLVTAMRPRAVNVPAE